MSGKSKYLFSDNFTVKDIDKEGKAFDKVSRLSCTSDVHEVLMVLDINMDIYPVRLNEQYSVLIASSLNPNEDNVETGEFNQQMDKSDLYKEYEYIMFGKVFRYKVEAPNASVYASFGGLLMRLYGDVSNFKEISTDSNMNIYLLMRKIRTSDI